MGVRLAIAAVVVMAAAGIAFALPADSPHRDGVTAAFPAAAHQRTLRVSALVPQLLYPGVRRQVVVRIANRTRRALTVDALAVTVTRASPGCPPRSLRVGRYRGPRIGLPAQRTRVVQLRARMSRNAANDCQRARFRFGVRVSASRR